VSKEQKGFVPVSHGKLHFYEDLTSSCVLLFFTLDLHLKMRSSSDCISVTAHDIMHSPDVSRGNEVVLIV